MISSTYILPSSSILDIGNRLSWRVKDKPNRTSRNPKAKKCFYFPDLIGAQFCLWQHSARCASSFSSHVRKIFQLSADKQVARPNTKPVVTPVENKFSSWYSSKRKNPRESMGVKPFTFGVANAVPMRVLNSSNPQPTMLGFSYLFQKSNLYQVFHPKGCNAA